MENSDGPAYYYGSSSKPSSDSTGCSVLGGEFFTPAATNYPTKYVGKYFFMDYCGGWIRYIDSARPPADRFYLVKTSATDWST